MRFHTIILLLTGLLLADIVTAQDLSPRRQGTRIISDHRAVERTFFNSAKFNFDNIIQGANGMDTSGANAVLAFNKLQERADESYADGEYQRAYEEYMQLAKFNDKYSQYMVGAMYANGQGVDQDLAEAFAWSYVSAENKHKEFVNAHVKLKQHMNPAQQQRGRDLAKQYREDFGTYALANKARRMVRKSKRGCTGSRLGSSCDSVASASLNCNASGQGVLSNECLAFGAIGLPSIAGMQPNHLRMVEKQLKELMNNYNPGKVELGELEIIED